jgi:DNA-directed RNA polymerase specialized sigma subunit
LQPGRKKTIKTVADSHVQLNFPPFQHWRYTSDGELICVGKSHWEGGLENGWFNKEHGTLTNKLVRQFMKLIQRYAQRSNWRYYTYNDEMQGTALLNMSQMCLKFDESKSQNPFAYYTAVITNSFTRVLNTEKKGQKIRDDILEANGLNPSYTRQYENEESKNKEAKAEAAKT